MEKRERAVAGQIAAEVRRRRTDRGWSQATLAELLDLSANYVGLLERAERLPSVEVLVRVAQTLGTSVGALVGEPAEEEADPWIAEGLAYLRAVPAASRTVTLAMLRGAATAQPSAADAEPTRRSHVRRRRSR